MNAKFQNRYRKLGIATALALAAELALLLTAAMHLLVGDPRSANDLIGLAGGFIALGCTLLVPTYLIASIWAVVLHWQQRHAHRFDSPRGAN